MLTTPPVFGRRLRRPGPWVRRLALLIAFAAAGVGGLSNRVWDIHRYFFGAAVVLYTLTAIALVASSATIPWRMARPALLLYAVAASSLLTVPFQETHYPEWIAGDLGVVLLPAGLMLLGASDPPLFSRSVIRIVVLLLVVVSVLSPLLAIGADVNDVWRYAPPMPAVVAYVWVWALGPARLRWLGIVALIAVAALAWYSDVRFAAVAIVLAGAGAAFLLGQYGRFLRIAGIVGMLAIVLATLGVMDLNRAIAASRFGQIDNTRALLEGPVRNRVYEVVDVVSYMRQKEASWRWATGFGAGATYRPNLYNFVRGNGPARDYQVTDDDLRHIIHFGPTRIYFRYGIVGLLAVIMLQVLLVMDAWRIGVRGEGRDPHFVTVVIAVQLYLLRWPLEPVFVDFFASWFVAAYLTLRTILWRSADAGSPGVGPPVQVPVP